MTARHTQEMERLNKHITSTTAACQILKDLWATCVGGSSALVQHLTSVVPDDAEEFPANPDKLEHTLYALYFLAKRLSDSEAAPTDLVEALSDCGKQQSLLSAMQGKTTAKRGFDQDLAAARKAKADADSALADAIAVKATLEKKYNTGAQASVSGILIKADQKVELAKTAQLTAATKLSDLLEKADDVGNTDDLETVKAIEMVKVNAIAAFSSHFLDDFVSLADHMRNANKIDSHHFALKAEALHALANLPVTSRTAEGFHKILDDASVPSDIAKAVALVSSQVDQMRSKLQIVEAGKGPEVEKILEANGVKIRQYGTNDNKQTLPPIQMIGYSLSLPLKVANEPKVPLWRGVAIEERHLDLGKVCAFPEAEDSQTWDMLAYEQLLLAYFYVTDANPVLSRDARGRLKTALQLARVKLKVPTKVHMAIMEYMLPDTEEHRDINPFDMRFRLLRMLAAKPVDDSTYKSWIDRQWALFKFVVNAWIKEDPNSSSEVAEVAIIVENTSMDNQYPPDERSLWQLIDACTDLSGMKLLQYPRGVTNAIAHRLWKCTVDPTSDTGLHADAESLISLIHNVVTTRAFNHHNLLCAASIWDKTCTSGNEVIQTSIVKTVSDILAGQTDWVATTSGEWFVPSDRSYHSDAATKGVANNYQLDLAYSRLMTSAARDSIINCLCDYRKRLDADSLADVVAIWKAMYKHLNTGVPSMKRPSDQEFLAHTTAMLKMFVTESAKAATNRLIDTSAFADPVVIARAHANDEARSNWIALVCQSLWRCIFEFACERDMYDQIWTGLGCGKLHMTTWASALQGKVRAVIELMANDDELWPNDRVPPGGTDLMLVCEIWERVSKDSGLTEVLKPKLTSSLSVRLDKIERESIPKCLHNVKDPNASGWQPLKPPAVLHSSKCIDLWSTVFTAVSACMDSAPLALSLHTCIKMVSRSVSQYVANALDSVPNDIRIPFPLAVKSSRCVNRMLKAQSDTREIPDLYKEKNRGKNKVFRTRASGRQYYEQGKATYQNENDEDGEGEVFNTGHTSNIITDNHMLLSEYILNLANATSHDAAAMMVRLQDLFFCITELKKAKEQLSAEPDREAKRLEKMIKQQLKYGTTLELPIIDKTVKAGYLQTIDKMVEAAEEEVNEAIPKVLVILVHRLVYIECKDDLFENMYVPTCSDNPFSSVVAKFQVNGWTTFLSLAPKEVNKAISRLLIDTLVNAWVYVVADMGARGRPFSPADVNILLTDSESLHGLADALGCKEDPAVQELLRLAGCLPLIVSGGSFEAAAEEALKEPNDVSPWIKKPQKPKK